MLALWISQNYQPDQSQPLVTTAPATTEIIQSKSKIKSKLINLLWRQVKISDQSVCRTNGGFGDHGGHFSLNGSCKIHGTSSDNVHMEARHESSGKGCGKPGHLCPEIYKALDGILFIAETKKNQEEKMRVNQILINNMTTKDQIKHWKNLYPLITLNTFLCLERWYYCNIIWESILCHSQGALLQHWAFFTKRHFCHKSKHFPHYQQGWFRNSKRELYLIV